MVTAAAAAKVRENPSQFGVDMTELFDNIGKELIGWQAAHPPKTQSTGFGNTKEECMKNFMDCFQISMPDACGWRWSAPAFKKGPAGSTPDPVLEKAYIMQATKPGVCMVTLPVVIQVKTWIIGVDNNKREVNLLASSEQGDDLKVRKEDACATYFFVPMNIKVPMLTRIWKVAGDPTTPENKPNVIKFIQAFYAKNLSEFFIKFIDLMKKVDEIFLKVEPDTPRPFIHELAAKYKGGDAAGVTTMSEQVILLFNKFFFKYKDQLILQLGSSKLAKILDLNGFPADMFTPVEPPTPGEPSFVYILPNYVVGVTTDWKQIFNRANEVNAKAFGKKMNWRDHCKAAEKQMPKVQARGLEDGTSGPPPLPPALMPTCQWLTHVWGEGPHVKAAGNAFAKMGVCSVSTAINMAVSTTSEQWAGMGLPVGTRGRLLQYAANWKAPVFSDSEAEDGHVFSDLE
mmetsp:Transcript_44290/g.111585  ORF Transcript_44290/g.111585 Transcript_44290/m.111585 type:complete len:457 (+) Transcript_44290:160-1530(+)